MSDDDRVAERFEAERPRLRAVAFRMLGSRSEADDAVQEAWLRLRRADAAAIGNLAGWLTTVVSRVCLDMLRSRRSGREAPFGLLPGAESAEGDELGGAGERADDPAERALTADAVGRALLVVLDRLSPAERVAFVLHDLFAVPFDEIAPVVDRSPVTAKKLASRARHRVRGSGDASRGGEAADAAGHRKVVDAFLQATRDGDVAALLSLLAPDVVRRADEVAVPAGVPAVLRGARAVAEETKTS
ncbi:MAG TPA: sigma-70 family RNA polymerase sigma factor, partial [Acidimicrobiales bacterium]|nr:sigma-70 family RNA polymerase sigma factor [Acidimicrobiales bacterium]